MRAELIPIAGGEPIAITRDITVIGRREYCDIQIDDPSLSKRHCVVARTDGLLVIRDLATTNGTKVKGQLIRWAALLPNDRLTLGKVHFRVYLGPDGTTAPVASSKPSKARSHGQATHPPAPVATTLPPRAATRAKAVAEGGPDDLRWLDQLGSVDVSDEIIDLD